MSRRRGRALLLACAALSAAVLAAAPATAQEVVGPWHGVLVIGANVLRVVVRVKPKAGGGYEGEMVSPDQSPRGIPISDIKLAGDRFSFAIPMAGASFEGTWDAGHQSWAGQFKQGASLPLTLLKGDVVPAAGAAAKPPPRPAAGAPAPAPTAGKPPVGKTVEALTVTGQSNAIHTDIDKRSYDITKDLQTQTGSIADALRNVPSVDVDVQGNVSLRGDSNVTIMIDGKPSSLFSGPARGQVLQSMPASAFERVEVMTNPSAAYRPDGSAGIINLIPKSAKAIGRSGSARVNLGPEGRANLGLSGYSVSKTLTLSGDAVYVHDRQDVNSLDERSRLDPATARFLDSTQDTVANSKVNVVVGRGAFDYNPDAKTQITGELRGTGVYVKAKDASLFTGVAPGGVLPEGFDRTGDTSFDRTNVAAQGGWRRKFAGEDHVLSVDLTEEHTDSSRDRAATTLSTTPALPSLFQDIRQDSTDDQTHVKADYSRPMPGDSKLKVGYELQVNVDDFLNSGTTGATEASAVSDPSLIDHFKFDQAVNGAYVTYQKPFGDLTVLGGLRLEDTWIKLDDVTTAFRSTRDDLAVYPSLHLAYKISGAQQLTASFSERIQRPAATDYDPFRQEIDPFNFQSGNPNLKPQETRSYEAGYQYRAGTTFYLATLYWRDNHRGVTDVVEDLGGGVLLTTKENLSNSQSGGLELVAAGKLTSTLSYQVSGNLGWTEIDASDLGFAQKTQAFTPSGRGVVNWQVTAKDLVQIQGNLTGKRLTPQGFHEPVGLVNVGYKHKFNDDWTLFVVGRDVLATYKDTLVIDTPTLHDRVETHVKLRAFYIGFTRTFGSGRRREPGFDYGTTTGAPQ
ncbi:MAG: TonB-dependent receptor [Phenylobacterium sp.]|nr:MAG: TonB-dependent receptor [Phenylobacterium sp.]